MYLRGICADTFPGLRYYVAVQTFTHTSHLATANFGRATPGFSDYRLPVNGRQAARDPREVFA
jgi:hypothetical protein